MTIPEFFTQLNNPQVWLVGSHMYGMATETSDEDYTAVFFSHEDYLNPLIDRESTKTNSTNDYTAHPLAKFAKLVVKGNFNALDLVFHPPVVSSPLVSRFIESAKPLAIHKGVAGAYMGYINSQKDRLVGHRARSEERKKEIERLGYDSKYAAHLLRGVRTLSGILSEGKYHYLLPREIHFLKKVRNGDYTKEELSARIDDEIAMLEILYEDNKDNLPSSEFLEASIKSFFVEELFDPRV